VRRRHAICSGAILSAETIKIEDREKGDPSRGTSFGLWIFTMTLANGENILFEKLANRIRRASTYDLKKDKGQSKLLVRTAFQKAEKSFCT